MKKITLTLVMLLLVLMVACSSRDKPGPLTNLDVINFRDFSVNATSVGLSTTTGGTVFVRGNLKHPEDITVRIVMTVAIDPDDWGGVGLYFPSGWKITGITSNFPQIDGIQNDLASVWTSGDPETGPWIAIGKRDAGSDPATDIRAAILIIDADYIADGEDTPETLDLKVAVGSKDRYILNPVSTNIGVPLLKDYRHPLNPVTFFPVQAKPPDQLLQARIEGELRLENGCDC